MSELVRYEAACRALAEAKAVDEVKDVLDQSRAIEYYARQAKNKDLEADAGAIRFRAERRLGEMLTLQKQAGELHSGGRPKKTGPESGPVSKAKLSDAGISKNLSSRAQKIAAVPEAQFEAAVADFQRSVKTEGARVTANLLNAGEAAIKAKARPEPEDAAALKARIAELEAEVEEQRQINERLTALTDGESETAAFIKQLQQRIADADRFANTLRLQMQGYQNEAAQAIRQARMNLKELEKLRKEIAACKK